jgi:putative FmdB family regulatory protein
MPLYEYNCHRCGKTFEVIQKFSDTPLSVHEGCGGEVERLISVSALQFKGTGWYVTDYGRSGRSSAGNGSHAKHDSKTESGKEKSTSTTGESKSDSKPSTPSAPTSTK